MRTRLVVLALLSVLTGVGTALASPISIYTAPDRTYGNTANSPCIFYGPGQSGCNKDPDPWFRNTENTDGAFPASPLTLTYAGADLLRFLQVVGNTFVVGFDVNDTSSQQFLETFTINATGGLATTSYTFSPTTGTPNTQNGVGYADYILSAGCAGTQVPNGSLPNDPQKVCNPALLTGVQYTPFAIPTGTTALTFTFRLGGGNDGSDKLFVIPTNPIGVPTQQCTQPGGCAGTEMPEPGSVILLGSGLAGLMAYMVRRRRAQA